MRIAILAVAVLAAAPAVAEDVQRTIVVPKGTERAYDDWHYAPAVKVGNMVIVSGVPAGRGATYEEKVRNMFEDIRRTLEAAGAQMGDVVELTSFHAEAKDSASFGKEFETMSKVHAEYFKENYPAWTAVGTTALLQPGAPVEMRAVAYIGAHRNTKVQRPAAK